MSKIDFRDAIKTVYQAYPTLLERKIQQLKNDMLEAEDSQDFLLWLSLADELREYKSYLVDK